MKHITTCLLCSFCNSKTAKGRFVEERRGAVWLNTDKWLLCIPLFQCFHCSSHSAPFIQVLQIFSLSYALAFLSDSKMQGKMCWYIFYDKIQNVQHHSPWSVCPPTGFSLCLPEHKAQLTDLLDRYQGATTCLCIWVELILHLLSVEAAL